MINLVKRDVRLLSDLVRRIGIVANFIHQKDAYIAMKVVEQFKGKALVYTVHDNFITTALYAKDVPKYYTKVFIDLGPPLKIINFFLIHNLFDNNKSVIDAIPVPISSIRDQLISLKPKNYQNKKNRLLKIDDMLSCYDKYVNTMCV